MSDVGSIYRQSIAGFGSSIADGIKEYQTRYEKDKQMLDTVQGYLDVAKKLQVPDPKTGKPKNFFNDEQLNTVQQLIKEKKAYQAGATASALGIGKGILQRAQSAQELQSGPVTTVKEGIRYRLTPHGEWLPVNAPPRNAMGQTPTQQANLQMKVQAQQSRGAAAQQAGLDKQLQTVGLDRASLFDPSVQQPGYMVDGKFQTPDDVSNDPRWKYHTDSEGNIISPGKLDTAAGKTTEHVTDFGDPSHIRVGYVPPVTDATGKSKGGNPGTVLAATQLQAYQDAAAKAAGPQASQALQWMRANPENPLAQKVNAKLQELVTQSGVNSVQATPDAPASDTGEDTQPQDQSQQPDASASTDNEE